LGFVGMDAQDRRGQLGLPQFPHSISRKDGSYHSPNFGASSGPWPLPRKPLRIG
jgi:hypothetical protein